MSAHYVNSFYKCECNINNIMCIYNVNNIMNPSRQSKNLSVSGSLFFDMIFIWWLDLFSANFMVRVLKP